MSNRLAIDPILIGKILDEYPDLIRLVRGDRNRKVSWPCSQEQPTDNGIVFISDSRHLEKVLNSGVAALVIASKMAHLVAKIDDSLTAGKTILESASPYLAMAKINARFFSPISDMKPIDDDLIHSSAVVAKSAKIAAGVRIGPGTVISEGVEIGENTWVGALAYIGPNCRIGREARVHTQAYVGPNCQLGDRVELKPQCVIGSDGYGFAQDKENRHHRIPHYGGVILENDVHIGACTTIDAGTFEPSRIGAGTKIDNHCHFGHNINIGKNCLFTGGQMAAGSVTIGDNCVFGGRSTINGHITITSGVSVAPLSGVSCSIEKPGLYGGLPPIPLRESQRIQMSIQHLPRMRRMLAKVVKHLGLDDDAEI